MKSKYSSTDDLTARTTRAAQLLKHIDAAYFLPVVRLLMANEQKSRRKPRVPRAKRVDVADRYGKKARGGSKGFVDQALLDAALKEETDGTHHETNR